jgi:hypothetical protein
VVDDEEPSSQAGWFSLRTAVHKCHNTTKKYNSFLLPHSSQLASRNTWDHQPSQHTKTPGTPTGQPNNKTQKTMPGSGKQSAQVQQQIIEFLEAGIDPTTIHRRLKVGRSSIYRIKRCLQQHGTPYAPPETNKKNGRPKVMNAEQEAVSFLPKISRTSFNSNSNISE